MPNDDIPGHAKSGGDLCRCGLAAIFSGDIRNITPLDVENGRRRGRLALGRSNPYHLT